MSKKSCKNCMFWRFVYHSDAVGEDIGECWWCHSDVRWRVPESKAEGCRGYGYKPPSLARNRIDWSMWA